MHLVEGVVKIVGTFFGFELCFRAGLVLLRSKDLGSEVPVVATALIIRLHQVSTLNNIVVLAPRLVMLGDQVNNIEKSFVHW